MNHTDRVAIADIMAERGNQDRKWGKQNHSDEIWLAILTEEIGETAQGILHEQFGGDARVRPELVQVAAVALAWLECIDRREPKEPEA